MSFELAGTSDTDKTPTVGSEHPRKSESSSLSKDKKSIAEIIISIEYTISVILRGLG
jgi:hypothetical protein